MEEQQHKDPGFNSWDSKQEFITSRRQRKLIMQRACDNSTLLDEKLKKSKLDHIIVNDRYKVLFCFVPKVACSQWKRVLLMMTGEISNFTLLDEYTVHHKYGNLLKYLSSYSVDEIKEKVSTYKKFIMVRDPFDRLVSAFKNKFHGTGLKDWVFRDMAKMVEKRYRDKDEKVEVEGVTFLQFVKFVTDDSIALKNEHWRPIMELCSPCHIEYDFIGKYETLQEDADFIMSQINTDIPFPEKPEVYGTTKTKDSLPFYFSQLPFHYIAKLWEVYKDDFKFFNYSFLKDIESIPYLV